VRRPHLVHHRCSHRPRGLRLLSSSPCRTTSHSNSPTRRKACTAASRDTSQVERLVSKAACPFPLRRLRRRGSRLHVQRQEPSTDAPTLQLGHLGLGAYGGNLLGAGQSFVQQNYARYVASGASHYNRWSVVAPSMTETLMSGFLAGNELRYYFTVNSRYVRNKLRMLLFPFSFRGPWHRAVDQQVRVPLVQRRVYICVTHELIIRVIEFHQRAEIQAASERHQRTGPIHSSHEFLHILPRVLPGGHTVRAEQIQARGAGCCQFIDVVATSP